MLVIQTKKYIYLFNVSYTNMEELKKNIKQFLKSAELIYQIKDYTSATILYLKAFFSILDLIILREKGKTPKDHTERFRILKGDFPELYEIIDRLFELYRSTYFSSSNQEDCNKIKYNVETTLRDYKIFEKN